MSLLKNYMKNLEDFGQELGDSKTLSILDDLLRKQHIGFDIGDSSYLEFAGPKGPNLSPTPQAGGEDYWGRAHDKPKVPGYSMKYTIDF